MKRLFTLLLVCLPFLAAVAQFDYSKVDSFAAQFDRDYEDAADLARQLTQPFDSAQAKARSIFTWIAHNVRYDVDKFLSQPPRRKFNSKADFEEWRAKELRKTLKNKKGVCEDYSRLYKEMCDAAGLECEVVVGDARDFYRPYKNIHDNPHAWNAVKWGGKWHLLDATWGAGYLDGKKFVRRVSTGYFDTPPAWFSQNHLPDEDRWQLLEQPVSKKDFPDQPTVNFGQDEFPLLDFSQKVEREERQSVLRFKFAKKPAAFAVVLGKDNSLKFRQEEKDGWVVLRFPAQAAGRQVTVFAGNSARSSMGWLARYEVK